jgi:RNA polymerase sigma factor (sigma-70 family)
MPTSPVSLIEHIRRAVPSDGDGDLLGRFVERRDETALAALVKLHGPMVWGVCRRLLAHHDAEDAYQATFIVLVRKASSVKPRGMVGHWLYGVARQVALQARTTVRRRAREIQVAQMPDVEAPQDRWADVRPILDEELSRLPDHYRAVIVLCDLEGRTRREVARQFGCPEGSVASRLARARAMLAKRLTGRGVAFSAVAAVLSQSMASAVPASVMSSTIKAASLCAAGKAAMPVKVAALTAGVLKAMLMSKIKAAVAVVLVLGFLAIGAIGIGFARGQKDDTAEQPKAQKDAVVKDKADKEETIAWGKEVDGLQMGLADAHSVRQGEKLKLTIKLRNVGKADLKFTHGLLREYAPEVTTVGGAMSVYMPLPKGYKVRLVERVIKPGETITLYNPEVAVESEVRAKILGEMRVDTPTICVTSGKYKIAYGGMIQSHPKLTTGTAEFEVKDQVAWGKEVDGVQVGILFGEDRVYKVGETVTLIVRLRNNGKKDVPFNPSDEYFYKNPPLITGAGGKSVKIKAFSVFGIISQNSVAPGKEAELVKLRLALRPATDREIEAAWTLYGTGKFQIQYPVRDVVGEVRLGSPAMTLTTGKLELEVRDKPPVAEKKPMDAPAKPEARKVYTPDEVMRERYDAAATRTVEFKVRALAKPTEVKQSPEKDSQWVIGHGPDDVSLLPQPPKKFEEEQFSAILTSQVVEQLKRIGIKEVGKHFDGKTIRISGQIRQHNYSGDDPPVAPHYDLVIEDVSQFEAVD